MINIEELSDNDIKDIIDNKNMLIKSKKIGEVGDVLELGDGKFRLVSVYKTSLPSIASMYHRVLGFDTPTDFINSWQEQHNIHEFASTVYIHHFKEI